MRIHATGRQEVRADGWFTSLSKHFVGRPHVELLNVLAVSADTAKRLWAARTMDWTKGVQHRDRTKGWGDRMMRLRDGSGTRQQTQQARGHPPLSPAYARAGSHSSSGAR